MRRLVSSLALGAAVLVVAALVATASPPKADASLWGNVQKIADHIKYHSNILHLEDDPEEYPPIGNNGKAGDIVVRPEGGGLGRPLDEWEEGDEIYVCREDWCFGELIADDPFVPGDGWVRVYFKPLFRPWFGDVAFDTPEQVITTESSEYAELIDWVVGGNPADEFNICAYWGWKATQ